MHFIRLNHAVKEHTLAFHRLHVCVSSVGVFWMFFAKYSIMSNRTSLKQQLQYYRRRYIYRTPLFVRLVVESGSSYRNIESSTIRGHPYCRYLSKQNRCFFSPVTALGRWFLSLHLYFPLHFSLLSKLLFLTQYSSPAKELEKLIFNTQHTDSLARP